MWILTSLFVVLTLSISWVLFGFILYNFFVGMLVKRPTVTMPEHFPDVTVLVPTYNEEAQILEKLADIRALNYPSGKIRVIFADGQSSDRTVELLRGAIEEGELIEVVSCPVGGKINQLNHVLADVHTEIVVNTDADARLDPDAVKWLMAEFVDESVWVAGAFCCPEGGFSVEQHYWDGQNKARLMETRLQTSSIVVAPCYGFRRSLMTSFPQDVVADDVYIAFLCNTLGHRTVYSSKALCREVRVPAHLDDFLPQKFRKSNAFLRESLRFVYRLPEMNGYNRVMHLTRVTQQLLMPWMLMAWVALAGSMVTMTTPEFSFMGRLDLAVFGAILLIFFFLITSWAFQRVQQPVEGPKVSLVTMIYGYILIKLVLVVTALSYPFYRQGSSYARIPLPDRAEASAGDGPVTSNPESLV